jgi:hypothetical protein
MDAFCSPIRCGKSATLATDGVVVARPQTVGFPRRPSLVYYTQTFKLQLLTAIVTYMFQVAGALLRSVRLSQPL